MVLSKLASKLDTCCAGRRMKKALHGWPSRSRDDIKFKHVGGVQFRYRERGSGTPIIFAADPPVTLELYDELLDTYASKFRVIVFEIPGMGFSVPEFGMDYAFNSLNDTIIRFLEAILDRPAVLAFSCAAGLGSIDIANRKPDLVGKIILIQTPSWEEEIAWKKSRDPKRILATPFIGQIAMHLLKRRRAPAWLNLAVGNRERFDSFCASALESLDQGAGWTMSSAFQMYLTDEKPGLPIANQPLLALWGQRDQTHLVTDKYSSLSLSKSSEIQLYEELGHFPDIEDVAQVYGDVHHFVNE